MPKTCLHTNCNTAVFSKKLCRYHWGMEYGKPIKKRLPVGPAKPRKPIAKMGAKRKANIKEYKPLRDKYMLEHRVCELRILCNGAPSEDLHHVRPREFFLCDVSVFKAACRACHDWIPAHDAEARKLGFLKTKHVKIKP